MSLQSPFFLVLILMAICCFGSFIWGLRVFFKAPTGIEIGMQVITWLGGGFMVLHLVSLLFFNRVSLWGHLFGVILYSLAFALFWWSIAANRQQPLSYAYSTDTPHHLVTAGPYRYIRHPFYSAYTIAWLAGIPASGHLWLFITVLIMFGFYWYAADLEEKKFTASALAEDYQHYQSCTGQFFPRLMSPPSA